MPDPDLEFVYVGDPMCSWCWGFAVSLDRLPQRYRIPVRTVVGGLRPGPSAEPLSPRLRSFLAEHWHHVTEASGQPFDFDALDAMPEGWRYDTEPGCRSVVAMRMLAPEHEFGWFKRLQRAFYAEAIDITDVRTHVPLLAPFEVDADQFLEVVESDAAREATVADFQLSRSWGITGFPSLLVRDGEEMMVVTRGWVDWEHLETQLTRWLGRRFPDQVDGLVCAIGEPC